MEIVGGARFDLAADMFCQEGLDRSTAHAAIDAASRTILAGVRRSMSHPLAVMPILRGGLAMLPAAQIMLGHPPTVFALCSRRSGPRDVECLFRPEGCLLEGRHVILLDVIAARGDTLYAVCRALQETPRPPRALTAVVCFLTRDAIERLETLPGGAPDLIAGRVAKGVDEHGFIIPSTHGDAGDKLFGALTA